MNGIILTRGLIPLSLDSGEGTYPPTRRGKKLPLAASRLCTHVWAVHRVSTAKGESVRGFLLSPPLGVPLFSSLSCRPFGIRQFSDKLVGGLGWANSHNHLGLAPRLRMRFRLYLPSTPCGRSTVKPEPSFRLGFAPISYAWSVTVCGSGLSLPPSHC